MKKIPKLALCLALSFLRGANQSVTYAVDQTVSASSAYQMTEQDQKITTAFVKAIEKMIKKKGEKTRQKYITQLTAVRDVQQENLRVVAILSVVVKALSPVTEEQIIITDPISDMIEELTETSEMNSGSVISSGSSTGSINTVPTIPSNNITPTTSTYTTPSIPTYSGRIYYTGPRGGCYYNNSNGNKVYVDRSFCN